MASQQRSVRTNLLTFIWEGSFFLLLAWEHCGDIKTKTIFFSNNWPKKIFLFYQKMGKERHKGAAVADNTREYKRGKYHCTIDLLFGWLGLVCFANKNKTCQLSYSWFQTSQTGGQWYSDMSPLLHLIVAPQLSGDITTEP
jgi:hypothetical protein